MIPKKPNLQFVLQTLNSLMGRVGVKRAYLILAKSMQEVVHVDKDHPMAEACQTLAISGAETLYINLAFWDKNIKSKYDMEAVLFHELLHHILGDTGRLRKKEREGDQSKEDLEGISTDARINALIYRLMPVEEGVETVFTRMYPPKDLDGILRPFSEYKQTHKLRDLYYTLYDDYYCQIRSQEDILNTLRLLYNHKVKKIQLIGTHGNVGEGEGQLKEMPKEVRTAIADAFDDAAQNAGHGNEAFKHLVKLINDQRQLDRRLLKSYSVSHDMNKLKAFFPSSRKSRKPVPIQPTNRDLLKMVINGQPPPLWKARKRQVSNSTFGVAIYLDVSGSVMDYLPKILRLISSMKKELTLIYCFSNKVAEQSINELRKGKVDTTGGTDFNCVANHILENEFSKCIVITDGYAHMSTHLQVKVRNQLKKCATVLFETSDTRRNWFSENYDTFYLDNIIK